MDNTTNPYANMEWGLGLAPTRQQVVHGWLIDGLLAAIILFLLVASIVLLRRFWKK